MQDVIVDADLEGHRFIRLYIVDSGKALQLREAISAGYEYVFAYALTDLGQVEGFTREEKWTQLLSLATTSDELFAGLHKNNRYKVRRTYRDPDVEIVVDDPARDASYDFYRAVKEADGVVPDIRADFSSVRWINAYRRGELISSTCWFDSGRVLRAKHIVSMRKREPEDAALIARLTRRLFWEACLLGLDNRYRYVDLGGLDPQDPDKKGVADFKRSFGGETVKVYVYRSATEAWNEAATGAFRAGATVV